MNNGIITEFDSKEVTKVRMRFGAEGYLAYVAIQELLFRNEQHILSRDYDVIASEICVDVVVVKGVVEELGLFTLTDNTISSSFVKAYFKGRNRLSEIRREAANSRWEKVLSVKAELKKNVNVSCPIDNRRAIPDIPYKMEKDTTSLVPREIPQDVNKKSRKRAKRHEANGEYEDLHELNIGAREIFTDIYREYFNSEYVWTGVDAGQMTNLLKKIRYSRCKREYPLPVDTKSMLMALKAFLYAINKEWILKNFSVSRISSCYNEIVSEIKFRSK